MVMYLGAEKAGLRLRDYRSAWFRVGELMFDDSSFGTPKGKTNELFSGSSRRRESALKGFGNGQSARSHDRGYGVG